MAVIILVLAGLGFLGCIGMLIRNGRVYRYRTGVLEKVSRAAKRDISLDREWRWRYDKIEEVSYNEMANRPWKKLDSFYKDKSFMEL